MKTSLHVIAALILTSAASTAFAGGEEDRLAYRCLYLDGRTAQSFEMKTQFSDAVVDRFQMSIPLKNGTELVIQAQALNEDKKDLQLGLRLQSVATKKTIAFAGAVADTGTNRIAALGLSASADGFEAVTFQVDCKKN